jgi:hypothetical protein
MILYWSSPEYRVDACAGSGPILLRTTDESKNRQQFGSLREATESLSSRIGTLGAAASTIDFLTVDPATEHVSLTKLKNVRKEILWDTSHPVETYLFRQGAGNICLVQQ